MTKKSLGVGFEEVNVVNSDDDGEEGSDDVAKTEDMGYQQTLMYGRYSKSLAEDIKEEARRQRVVEKIRLKEQRRREERRDKRKGRREKREARREKREERREKR